MRSTSYGDRMDTETEGDRRPWAAVADRQRRRAARNREFGRAAVVCLVLALGGGGWLGWAAVHDAPAPIGAVVAFVAGLVLGTLCELIRREWQSFGDARFDDVDQAYGRLRSRLLGGRS